MRTGNNRPVAAPHVMVSVADTEQEIARVEVAVRQYCRWMIEAYLDQAKPQVSTSDEIGATPDLGSAYKPLSLKILE